MGEQEATTDPAAIAATLTPAMRTMLLTGTPPAAGGFTDPGQAVTWLTGSIARLRARMPQQDPALLRPRGGSIYDRVTARAAYDVLTTLDRAVAERVASNEPFSAAAVRRMLIDAAGQHGIAAEWAARDAS